jgi:hypothetical protein
MQIHHAGEGGGGLACPANALPHDRRCVLTYSVTVAIAQQVLTKAVGGNERVSVACAWCGCELAGRISLCSARWSPSCGAQGRW